MEDQQALAAERQRLVRGYSGRTRLWLIWFVDSFLYTGQPWDAFEPRSRRTLDGITSAVVRSAAEYAGKVDLASCDLRLMAETVHRAGIREPENIVSLANEMLVFRKQSDAWHEANVDSCDAYAVNKLATHKHYTEEQEQAVAILRQAQANRSKTPALIPFERSASHQTSFPSTRDATNELAVAPSNDERSDAGSSNTSSNSDSENSADEPPKSAKQSADEHVSQIFQYLTEFVAASPRQLWHQLMTSLDGNDTYSLQDVLLFVDSFRLEILPICKALDLLREKHEKRGETPECAVCNSLQHYAKALNLWKERDEDLAKKPTRRKKTRSKRNSMKKELAKRAEEKAERRRVRAFELTAAERNAQIPAVTAGAATSSKPQSHATREEISLEAMDESLSRPRKATSNAREEELGDEDQEEIFSSNMKAGGLDIPIFSGDMRRKGRTEIDPEGEAFLIALFSGL